LERSPDLARAVRLLAALVTVSALAGLVGAGLVLPVVATAAGATAAASAVMDELPVTLPAGAVPQTSVILAADGTPIAYLYDENRTAVPLASISPLMRQAIVAVEDSRFYQHGAIDPKGVLRAVVSNSTGGGTEGASTLTQQYVKNLLVETASAAGNVSAARAAVARTPARKLREAKLAMRVEQQLSKDQILERYLNIAYFGEGSYGVQAAAMRYFGVPAQQLTLPEAALLAGLVQDPAQFDPASHPAAARERRDVVLAEMRQQGMITAAQLAAGRAAAVRVSGSGPPGGCIASATSAFFCQYVVATISQGSAYAALGASPADRRHALQTGGLVIRTSLDLHAQESAQAAVNTAIPPDDPSGLGSTAVTVEPRSGRVTTMVQNRAYSVTPGTGRTSVNYATDSTAGGSQGFQTGSSFKPFTLATWLTQGHSLDDTVDATKRAFAFSDFTACGKPLRGARPYTPGNSEGNEGGQMSVRSATANSVNVAFVQMETQLDLCDISGTASQLGVHLAAPEKPECGGSAGAPSALPTCLPSLTLGVKNIAPLTMAAAYAGFAAGGTYCAPLPVTSIEQRGGDGGTTRIEQYSPQCRQALRPEVAAGVTTALSQVLTNGTAAAVGQPGDWPAAGKTGTTDGPYDTWFVGYTAQRSTAVWVGDPGSTRDGASGRRRLTDIEVGGHYYPIMFGASLAAPIWKNVTTSAMHGLPPGALP
jgi:membrane peptidoglycan carboxypeptidase